MSSPSKLSVPDRTSSRAALTTQRLTLQASQNDTKRKLSTVSFDDNPVEHTKLRIKYLEQQKSEQHLETNWLDVARREKGVTDNEYYKAMKTTNGRIISIGDDLWREKKKLRAIEEQKGLAPEMTPDSSGPFVATLLRLYKDPSRSIYEVNKNPPSAGRLYCVISGDWFENEDMKAAHIVPYRLGPEIVDYVFGAGTGSRLLSADNCLMMHTTVKRAFDKGSFVLLPVDPNERPIKRWKIQVTNSGALDTTDLGKRPLRDRAGAELIFKNPNRPTARFLYFHFVVTLLRARRDRQSGWETYRTTLPTGKPFATMGPYLRKSLLLTLAKAVGDLDADSEVELLGEEGKELFADDRKLSPSEEDEVARRILEAKDEKADGQ